MAISDPTQTLASPLDTIKNDRKAIARIRNLIQERGVSKIVVGYPYNLKGEKGVSAEKVDDFLEQLDELGVETVRWDERFSTVTAMNLLHQAGAKVKSDKGRIDKSAAAVILQHFLDAAK